VEVVASFFQGRTAAAQCGLFTYKSVPVIFEPPCTRLLPTEHKNYAYVNQLALFRLQILQLTCCKEVIWNSILLYWVRRERHNSVFCTDPWNCPGDCTRGIRVDIEMWWKLSEFYRRFERPKPFQEKWHIDFQNDNLS